MKDNEIHKGLDNVEIRDFLSHSIYNYYAEQAEISRKYDTDSGEICRNYNGIDYTIKYYELNIERNQKMLKAATKLKAKQIIIKQMGWDEHDVSDDVRKTNDMYCLSFIGTQNEYDLLMKKINKEKEL